MERYSDIAIDIINDLHTERIDYDSEYIPLINAANKLAEYENAEESGLLAHLPCEVGNMMYVIYDGYVTSAKVLAFYIDRVGVMFDLKIRTKIETATGWKQVISKDYTIDDIGKTVFLTRESAQQAVKGEMEDA